MQWPACVLQCCPGQHECCVGPHVSPGSKDSSRVRVARAPGGPCSARSRLISVRATLRPGGDRGRPVPGDDTDGCERAIGGIGRRLPGLRHASSSVTAVSASRVDAFCTVGSGPPRAGLPGRAMGIDRTDALLAGAGLELVVVLCGPAGAARAL